MYLKYSKKLKKTKNEFIKMKNLPNFKKFQKYGVNENPSHDFTKCKKKHLEKHPLLILALHFDLEES